MAGRPRLPIGAFGAITTTRLGPRRFRASARVRDLDGQTRQVAATGSSRSAAESALKVDLAHRMRGGDASEGLNADSPFSELAEAWLADLLLDVDRAESTKEIYERELRSLVLPFSESFTVREVTVGRIERFLKLQRVKPYTPGQALSHDPFRGPGVRGAAGDHPAQPGQGDSGTILVRKGAGVVRQSHPKTHESNRVVGVPPFASFRRLRPSTRPGRFIAGASHHLGSGMATVGSPSMTVQARSNAVTLLYSARSSALVAPAPDVTV